MRPLLLLLGLLARPAAALPASDAVFASQFRFASSLRVPASMRGVPPARLEQLLAQRLGWYAQLEAAPSFDAARMSRIVVDGLRRGPYRSLILGESHGIDAEIDAGKTFVADLLGSGASIGALIRESNTYPDIDNLTAAGVPVLTYRSQFVPEKDVRAALSHAGSDILISYTGSAHTSQHAKNYFQNVLLTARPFGYGPGHKDMPTVEDSLERAGRRPLIVAMMKEEHPLQVIQYLFLKDLVAAAPEREALLRSLADLQAEWARQTASWPARAEPIVFVQDPGQANLYVGLTPADRRPLTLAAAAKTLTLPELMAWLGDAKITMVESLAGTSGTPTGGVERYWRVVVHAEGRTDFERVISEADVFAAAAAYALP